MSLSPPSPTEVCRRTAIDVLSNASLIPLDLIFDAPGQPRRRLPDVERLAANICAYGLLQPVALRRLGPQYQIIAGHRRVGAYRLLRRRQPSNPEWSAISAVVTRTDDETASLSMVSAQVHIQAWAPAEERQVLKRLTSMGLNMAEIGRLLHRDVSWTSKRVRVLEDVVLGDVVESGALPVSVAEELLPIRNIDDRKDLVERAVTERWHQSEARVEVAQLKASRETPSASRRRHLPERRKILELRRCAGELLALVGEIEPGLLCDTPAAVTDLWAVHDAVEARIPQPRQRVPAA